MEATGQKWRTCCQRMFECGGVAKSPVCGESSSRLKNETTEFTGVGWKGFGRLSPKRNQQSIELSQTKIINMLDNIFFNKLLDKAALDSEMNRWSQV